MSNVNEVIFVPAFVVVDALLSADGSSRGFLSFAVDRNGWMDTADHAVCSGKIRISVEPSLPSLPPISQELDDNLHTSAPRADGEQTASLVCKPPAVTKLPLDLLARYMVLKKTKRAFRSRISNSSVADMSDINELNRTLVKLVQASFRHATTTVSTLDPEGMAKSAISEAKRTELLARRRLRLAVQIKRQHSASERKRALREVRMAEQAVRSASSRLHRIREKATYHALLYTHARAPKYAWKRMEREMHPSGASQGPTQSKLLLQLHDTTGKIISTDKLAIVQHLVSHRKGVFQVRAKLDDSCEHAINTALVQMQIINQQILADFTSIKPEATCARVVQDICYLTRPVDQRRSFHRDETELQSPQIHQAARTNVAQIAARRERFVRECLDLEKEITIEELEQVVANAQEVGTGVDGMQTAAIRHFRKDELEHLVRLLNLVWNQGVCPDDWKLVRCLLHHKGKGSDVYCVANYRGLGISDGNCKLLSLVMTRRLELFLESTSGLSNSQGGFRPKRGTPEQTFTLVETVRNAIQENDVQLCFVDIERAYDSVLHPILWKRCADIGIGGRFLSTLQAMYDGASAQMEIDKHIVKPTVPIECGVLQGSPLSPLLFNIYFDPIIRAQDEAGQQSLDNKEPALGIPLPHVTLNRFAKSEDLAAIYTPTRKIPTQEDRLTSLWFADDGTLPSFTTRTLQKQVDILNASLKASGFNLNVPKTKWLFVPKRSTTEEQYRQAKAQLLLQPLCVNTVEFFRNPTRTCAKHPTFGLTN
jgi:hypothetical protein